MPATLSNRDLNRALLARQWLLERREASIESTLEHVVGLQAQTPQSPYYAMEARLEGFNPQAMSNQLARREAVRGTLFRGTIHWVTLRDWLRIRPLIQPVVERLFRGQRTFASAVHGLDIDQLRSAGLTLLVETPRTGSELGRLLQTTWPDRDGRALANAAQYLEPVVQAPPRGLWRQGGQPVLASPPRFLPDYDNVFLSHAERSRIMSDEHWAHWTTRAGVGTNAFRVDGFCAGLWRMPRERETATLLIGPVRPLSDEQRAAFEAEGTRPLRFAAPEGAALAIQFAPVSRV